MADVVGAAAEGEHKLDAGEIVPVINTEETKGRLLKSIMISSLEHGNPNQRFYKDPNSKSIWIYMYLININRYI